jgi:hypothetical protein
MRIMENWEAEVHCLQPDEPRLSTQLFQKPAKFVIYEALVAGL